MKTVLVINSGSSSVKYELFDMTARTTLATGLVERIGEEQGRLKHRSRQTGAPDELIIEQSIPDHRSALELIERVLSESDIFDRETLYGIGHRVVHGGEQFDEPTLIDSEVRETIRRLAPLAPLHNPANLVGIEIAMSSYPNVPQVAVFDTAFHQTLPRYAYHYAIPHALYKDLQIRRYGFHGTSHAFVAKQVANHLGQALDAINMIVFHLGNGASATAIQNGKSIDTSMGLTPLEGLIMGTRCGDLDPAIIFHVGNNAGKSFEEIDRILNKESGLKGICGNNDMRSVAERAEQGDEFSGLAVDMFCYRIKKYLGAYYAALGHVDAIAFTAGIGENSALVRQRSCDNLAHLGIQIDPAKNSASASGLREIQTENSRVKVLVVPTDEELEIAEQTVACIDRMKS